MAACLLVARMGPHCAGAVVAGDPVDRVFEELGPPESYIHINGTQVLYYERGKVQVTDEVVVSAELVSAEEAVRLRREREMERLQREEELRVLRERRSREGADVLESMLADPGFMSRPPAQRLSRWRALRRDYPETPMPEDYFVAMREREQELKEVRAAQRIRELEDQVARAEEEASRARGGAYTAGYFGASVPPITYVYPVGYHVDTFHHGRRAERCDHPRPRKPPREATFIPYHGTAGYGFQRNLGIRSSPRRTAGSIGFLGTSHDAGTRARIWF